MGAQLPLVLPAVEQDTAVGSGGFSIEPFPVKDDFDREAPVSETQRRTPEGGAGIAVDQGQLPFVIADQLLDICPVTHQPKGIVGGDPSAACGGRGAETVAVFVFGDVVLIVDQILHIILQWGARR